MIERRDNVAGEIRDLETVGSHIVSADCGNNSAWGNHRGAAIGQGRNRRGRYRTGTSESRIVTVCLDGYLDEVGRAIGKGWQHG